MSLKKKKIRSNINLIRCAHERYVLVETERGSSTTHLARIEKDATPLTLTLKLHVQYIMSPIYIYTYILIALISK